MVPNMRPQSVVITEAGSQLLRECRQLLEERDGLPWSNARVVHFALVNLKKHLQETTAAPPKETAHGEPR